MSFTDDEAALHEAATAATGLSDFGDDRYREGLTTLVELLDAETALTRARTREVATLRDLAMSEAALRLAVGRL